MKNTGKFNEYILKDLKTDDDIKEWINIGFEEFLQPGEFCGRCRVYRRKSQTEEISSFITRNT